MAETLNDFILLDAAVWAEHPQLDDLLQEPSATALYGDMANPEAPRCGPWLLNTVDMTRHITSDIIVKWPWCHGASRLLTTASHGEVVAHLMSQRSIGMEAGDSYWLRFADTRVLLMLDRILSPDQIRQLKGPVAHWYFIDRASNNCCLGRDIAAVNGPQPMIILSETQSGQLFHLQLVETLATDIHHATDNPFQPLHNAAHYGQIEAMTGFAAQHGIEPFAIQQHIALLALHTEGRLLNHAPFLQAVASLRGQNRWDELLHWQYTPKGSQT